MNLINSNSIAFCTAVKYSSKKDYFSDFSNTPRPCHNFAFMLEGHGKITAGNTTFEIKKGDIIYIPKNSTYTAVWTAEPNCIFHSVHFNFSPAHDPFQDKIVPIQRFENADFDKLYEMVALMQQYQYCKSVDGFMYLSAFYYLCGILLPQTKMLDSVLHSNNIAPALLYLENNYTKPCTVAELSNLCFLSPSRFFYVFKKQVGCSPIAYKNKLAIQKISQELILDKYKNIETLAQEYGFTSSIYFTRLFKKIMGKTPSEYRKSERLI